MSKMLALAMFALVITGSVAKAQEDDAAEQAVSAVENIVNTGVIDVENIVNDLF